MARSAGMDFLMMSAIVSSVPQPALSQVRGNDCRRSNVVVADRSSFYSTTIQFALAALRQTGLNGIPMAYRLGADTKEFARRVAAARPKLFVAHYSMFAPGSDRRGEAFIGLFQTLEASSRPMHYVIYSSAFAQPERSLPVLRRAGLLQGISDERITLIYVPSGNRFRRGNGDRELREVGLALKAQGLCTG